MKWIAISGSWRKVNKEIEDKIRTEVREVMLAGNGIVSGGALNVDFIALDEALKYDSKAERIKIFLPTTLEKYTEHYRKHAKLGSITSEQAEALVAQLTHLKEINNAALVENPDTNFNEENKKDRYYERNSEIVGVSNELVAFRVITEASKGEGTSDTVQKAKEKGIPVKLFEWNLTNSA